MTYDYNPHNARCQMLTMRDIPKVIRELPIVIDSFKPIEGQVDDALIIREAYSLSALGDYLKVTFHKVDLSASDYDQMTKDVFKALRGAK